MLANGHRDKQSRVCRLLTSVLLSALLCLIARNASSETTSDRNWILVLDASGSMAQRLDGVTKLNLARKEIGRLVETALQTDRWGLVVYGSRRVGDCSDIDVPVRPSAPEASKFSRALKSVFPTGRSPIAASLERAADEAARLAGPTTVILFTEGTETCGGNPCAVARHMREDLGLEVRVSIIALDPQGDARMGLECAARESGGVFLEARTQTDLTVATTRVLQQATEAKRDPQPPPPPRPQPRQPDGNARAMLLSLLHPGLGEFYVRNGVDFWTEMPPKKFWLGFIPIFGWPGYLQVVSAIDAYHDQVNDWGEEPDPLPVSEPPASPSRSDW